MKKVEKSNGLPVDVLEFIFRELDFDDLFEFAGVCKSWRIGHKHYWTNFMESQSPLIVETTKHAKKVYSFFSIPNLKIYQSTMHYFWGLHYCGSSSGYQIMAGDKKKNILLLMNPFTRRKKQISTSALEGNFNCASCRPLLAFAKGSDEFVIVVSSYTRHCPHSLCVYQSRNSSWVTYSTMTDPWKVVDFVVLHNTIYVLSDRAKIGVLSLNSAGVKFLNLKNTIGVPTRVTLRLVTCDGQLLVVQFMDKILLSVHKIDFSTMEYVKLETLGDLALFHSPHTNCYALSNPGRWGYDSNSVYHIPNIGSLTPKCEVYSWNNERKKCIVRDDFGAPTLKPNTTAYWMDWCFRHQHNEVDYSLVD